MSEGIYFRLRSLNMCVLNPFGMSSDAQKLGINSNPVLFDPFGSNRDSELELGYRYIGNQTEEMRNSSSCKKSSCAFRNFDMYVNVSAMNSMGAAVAKVSVYSNTIIRIIHYVC
jgi:hypothetical protein